MNQCYCGISSCLSVIRVIILSQPAHNVRTTLYGRWCDLKTLKWRPYDVFLTSCAMKLVKILHQFWNLKLGDFTYFSVSVSIQPFEKIHILRLVHARFLEMILRRETTLFCWNNLFISDSHVLLCKKVSLVLS